MKLCTMGLGYIGLPTSLMFAKHGVDVVGVDIHPDVINKLNNGKLHIEEPGLEEVLNEVLDAKRFRAALNPEPADVFIIAVPTPNNEDQHQSCDLPMLCKQLQVFFLLFRREMSSLLNRRLHQGAWMIISSH